MVVYDLGDFGTIELGEKLIFQRRPYSDITWERFCGRFSGVFAGLTSSTLAHLEEAYE